MHRIRLFPGHGSPPFSDALYEKTKVLPIYPVRSVTHLPGLYPTACKATSKRILKCEGWRLPTEAEWEYAARAGSTESRYGEMDSIAWHDGNSAKKTHRVGLKRENAWGLRDMLGNVWEWTMDVYGAYTKLSSQDPLRTRGGRTRVIRGGAWLGETRDIRTARRSFYLPSLRENDLGFRLLRY